MCQNWNVPKNESVRIAKKWKASELESVRIAPKWKVSETAETGKYQKLLRLLEADKNP